MSVHGYWYFTMRKKFLEYTEEAFDEMHYSYDGITKSGMFRKWPTWTSLIGIMYYRGRIGNCQDGAWYIKKILKQSGKKARIRIYIPGINVSKIHYVVECDGYVYDLATVGFRKRQGTAKQFASLAYPNKHIYFVQ